jgi:hypothetical protein
LQEQFNAVRPLQEGIRAFLNFLAYLNLAVLIEFVEQLFSALNKPIQNPSELENRKLRVS